MKLLCITHTLAGGAAKSLWTLLRYMPPEVESCVLTQRHVHPNIFMHENIPVGNAKTNPIPLHLVGIDGTDWYSYLAWLVRLAYLQNTLGLVKRYNPDIVLLNGYTSLYYAPFLSMRAKVVLYAREILKKTKVERRLLHFFLNNYIAQIICISENEASQLKDVRCPVDIVYNSNEREINEVLRSPRHNDSSFVKVGIFGQITRIKGQWLILEAIRYNQEILEQNNIQFYIFGDHKPGIKANLGELKLQVEKHHWHHLVKFPGWVFDVQARMQQMDIVLRPELTGYPWGRDVIEAMSNGLPVIASGYSQIFIKPGVNGELFDPGDVHLMTEHIVELAQDPKRRQLYGINAQKFARTNFEPSKNSSKVFELLNRTLSTS